jgi:L-iditol 2-dehydrogenase
MRALVKRSAGRGGLELSDVPEPELRAGAVRVRPAAVGICGTDRLALEGAYDYPTPLILGHEVAGVVTELGDGVDPEEVAVGDRVTLETDAYVCGRCPYCRGELYNNCPYRKAIGTTADGGLADSLVIRAPAVHRLPERVSLVAGALVEPLAIAVHAALERSAPGVGDLVVVVGPGAIGLLVAQVARSAGAHVLLVGRRRHADRLALARRLGVDRAVDSESEDLAAAIAELSGGLGADLVYECSGAASVVADAPALVRKGGRLVLVAWFGDTRPPLDVHEVIERELDVAGSRGKRPSSYRRSLALLADGRVDVESVVTHRLPLERWEHGFSLLGGGRKVVFEL